MTAYSINCLVHLVLKLAKILFIYFCYPKHFSGAIFSRLSFNIFSTQHLTSLCIYVFQNDEQTRHPSWDAELGSYDQGWSYLKIGSSARSRGRFSLNRVKLFLLLTCRSAILHQTQRKRRKWKPHMCCYGQLPKLSLSLKIFNICHKLS